MTTKKLWGYVLINDEAEMQPYKLYDLLYGYKNDVAFTSAEAAFKHMLELFKEQLEADLTGDEEVQWPEFEWTENADDILCGWPAASESPKVNRNHGWGILIYPIKIIS